MRLSLRDQALESETRGQANQPGYQDERDRQEDKYRIRAPRGTLLSGNAKFFKVVAFHDQTSVPPLH